MCQVIKSYLTLNDAVGVLSFLKPEVGEVILLCQKDQIIDLYQTTILKLRSLG